MEAKPFAKAVLPFVSQIVFTSMNTPSTLNTPLNIPTNTEPVRRLTTAIPFSFGSAFVLFCVCCVACLSICLITPAPLAAQKSEKVYVPSVPLVFRSLDSLAKNKLNWRSLAIYSQTTTYSNRYMIALNLGIRASDAFVAAQGKDDDNFLKMAISTAGLSSKLGVEMDQTLNAKMVDMVKQSKWDEVKKLLDEQQSTMKSKIGRLDKDASVLVVVGGWLEGLQVVSKALISNYNENNTNAIRNPKVLEYLIGELNNLSKSAIGNPIVKKITQQLPTVKELVSIDKTLPVPLDNIKKISTITSGLVKEIESAKD